MVSVDGIAVKFNGHTLFKDASFVVNEILKVTFGSFR